MKIEVEDRIDEEEERLEAEDERSADEFVALLKELPEEERDAQIKLMHKRLASGCRLLVHANVLISGYEAERKARESPSA